MRFEFYSLKVDAFYEGGCMFLGRSRVAMSTPTATDLKCGCEGNHLAIAVRDG